MEIFLHDRIIHTRNARYLPSYSQRVMNNTKNSDHPTNPEYTSTHLKPNQSPIENVHPAPIHPKYTSTYLYPVNQKQTKKKPFKFTHEDYLSLHYYPSQSVIKNVYSSIKMYLLPTPHKHKKCKAFLLLRNKPSPSGCHKKLVQEGNIGLKWVNTDF